MALFNYTAKEITLKIVYYGPGFCGKTTNLQQLHTFLPSDSKGKLISMATEGDRTIFFDFLPVEIGRIKEFNIRFQLYTVPGQIRYNATRKLVLKGADAIVFVADSQRGMLEQNIESLENMRENLMANNISLDIPKVFQYNKRDIDNVMSIDELNQTLNKDGAPFFEAVAVEGKGVEKTFRRITKDVLEYIQKKHNVDIVVPESAIIPEGAAATGAAKEHVFLHDAKYNVPETLKKATVPEPPQKPFVPPKPEQTPPVYTEPVREAAPKPQAAPSPAAEPKPYRETITVQPQITVPPVDLTELVAAIKGLKDAVAEISSGLRGIQINQTKSTEALTEIKNILSKAKESKGGLMGLFR
jgi:signal recognition particle receptor subunit beta